MSSSHFVSSGLCQWHHEQGGMCCKNIKVQIPGRPAFLCKRMAKNDPTCLPSEKLTFEAKEYIFCVNTDGITTWSLQLEIVSHFVFFQASLYFHFSSFKRLPRNGSMCYMVVVIIACLWYWCDMWMCTAHVWLYVLEVGISMNRSKGCMSDCVIKLQGSLTQNDCHSNYCMH